MARSYKATLARFIALGALLSFGAFARTAFAAPERDGEHGSAAGEHGPGAHGGGHGPGEINWMNGFIGESEDAHPSSPWEPTLFRPKGTPPPLMAMLINTAILFYILGRVGAPKITTALKRRKTTIMQGMDEAARMKEQAAARLVDYETKLERIDDDIERVKREMREAGEAERARMLADAKEKRARMERDAKLLIEQELKAARETLLRETVRGAVISATDVLSKQVTSADQQRLADEYVKSLAKALGARS
jgi:F-type H+-transporting ATPase subunit b